MKKFDLIVVGGGLTGIAASVCAARGGMSVLLCEQGGALGGAMVNCLVLPFMRYFEKHPETGEISYHNLAERFGMSAQDFDKLYAPERTEEFQMEQ